MPSGGSDGVSPSRLQLDVLRGGSFSATIALPTLKDAGRPKENQMRLKAMTPFRISPRGNRFMSQNSVANLELILILDVAMNVHKYDTLAIRTTNGLPPRSDQNSHPPGVSTRFDVLRETLRTSLTTRASSDDRFDSMRTSLPPGFKTRQSSLKARSQSGMCIKTPRQWMKSKWSSGNESCSSLSL